MKKRVTPDEIPALTNEALKIEILAIEAELAKNNEVK